MDTPTLIFGSQFLKKVSPVIRDAKHSIDIIVFYWSINFGDINDPVSLLLKELQDACKRGVTVRVLVNNYKIGEKLMGCGFRVRHCYTSKLMHPKAMLIDKEIAIIGSHNYTMSGFTLNMEISAILKLPPDKNDLVTFFNHLWGI